MKRLCVAMVPLAACLFAFGCQQGDKDKQSAKTDAEFIQGTWSVTSSEQGGKEDDFKNLQAVITGKSFVVWEDKDKIIDWAYKLDPSKSPREIDFEETH